LKGGGINKKNMIGIIIILIIVVPLSILWVRGIDYMNTNHPDYKGEDWLNWDEDDKNTIL
jgi:hypothetical protein